MRRVRTRSVGQLTTEEHAMRPMPYSLSPLTLLLWLPLPPFPVGGGHPAIGWTQYAQPGAERKEHRKKLAGPQAPAPALPKRTSRSDTRTTTLHLSLPPPRSFQGD